MKGTDLETWESWLAAKTLFQPEECPVRLLDASVVSNVLSLSVDAVHLQHPFRHETGTTINQPPQNTKKKRKLKRKAPAICSASSDPQISS